MPKINPIDPIARQEDLHIKEINKTIPRWKSLPTYCTISFHDTGQSNTEAFREGVRFARKQIDTIRDPSSIKFFEAGIISVLASRNRTKTQ